MDNLKYAWLFAALLLVSCAQDRDVASKGRPSSSSSLCDAITNAINRGDWDSLRRVAKPGMGANEYITMWENARKTGHAIHVGKQMQVERDAEINGKKCTKYSYALVNADGTANPHWLQIMIGERDGKSELLDFWNFGW